MGKIVITWISFRVGHMSLRYIGFPSALQPMNYFTEEKLHLEIEFDTLVCKIAMKILEVLSPKIKKLAFHYKTDSQTP